MMDGWMGWVGKKVFVRLRSHQGRERIYSGVIKGIDETSKPLIFIHLLDKFGAKIILLHSEIVEIKEEY